ncbi:DUF4405 domain-containing protein [Heliobacterium chlorum]|nr:DUF4405 domain-containing protein [Heliobacterium chlorum]
MKGIHEVAGLAMIPAVLLHFGLNAKTLVAELGLRKRPEQEDE